MDTRPNRSLWLGPLLALFGFLSYYTLFYRWPALRDLPWLNLAILGAAVTISWIGLGRARPRGGWRLAAGVAGFGWSVFLTGLLSFYCFSYSYNLPDDDLALAVGAPAPAVTLLDHLGRETPLDDGSRTLLVFYRGHW